MVSKELSRAQFTMSYRFGMFHKMCLLVSLLLSDPINLKCAWDFHELCMIKLVLRLTRIYYFNMFEKPLHCIFTCNYLINIWLLKVR